MKRHHPFCNCSKCNPSIQTPLSLMCESGGKSREQIIDELEALEFPAEAMFEKYEGWNPVRGCE